MMILRFLIENYEIHTGIPGFYPEKNPGLKFTFSTYYSKLFVTDPPQEVPNIINFADINST